MTVSKEIDDLFDEIHDIMLTKQKHKLENVENYICEDNGVQTKNIDEQFHLKWKQRKKCLNQKWTAWE